MHKRILSILFLLPTAVLFSQKLKKEDQLTLSNLHRHIEFLSNDKLEGRRVGTPGEMLAAEYISQEFEKNGLSGKGSNGYYQLFEINEGWEILPATSLTIEGQKLETGKDFFPLSNSPDVNFEATPSIALQEPGMPWFYDLKEIIDENRGNPHFDLENEIAKSAKQIKKRGGTAVFIYNSSGKPDGLRFNKRFEGEKLAIPVVYVSPSVSKKYFSDPSASMDIKFRSAVAEKKRTGRNVVGYIDNQASTTIVIGAHFDHLGLGEDGNSRETTLGKIHNGADDNASGTAAVIELGRLLRGSKWKKNNYLLIGFSGEEMGLYGSKYFTEHPTVDLSSVSYMINMDMIGRLSDSSHVVTVGGYGTSPLWGNLYSRTGKKKLEGGQLVFRFDSSGTGPSDHTSFYLKNIPVLFYFTGLHPDYHKSTDDFDKINYNGELQVLKHVMSVIEASDKEKTRPAFTKTREVQTSTNAKFSVTLGIMPDYTFAGTGVRVDGVSDNRPAQKAGVKTGDIIMSLGSIQVKSLEDYMQALSGFKKGDKTKLVYKRESSVFTTEVEF